TQDKARGSGGEPTYVVVEKPPSYPGGMVAFVKAVQQNLDFPSKAVKRQFTARMYFGFVVERDGHLSDITCVRDSGSPELNNTIPKAIEKCGPWNPGLQKGQPVRVRMVVVVSPPH